MRFRRTISTRSWLLDLAGSFEMMIRRGVWECICDCMFYCAGVLHTLTGDLLQFDFNLKIVFLMFLILYPPTTSRCCVEEPHISLLHLF